MAEVYKPRLTAPSTSDKNWIKSTKGGYNYCIEIKNGSCLPNCVGYAWGRWRELLGSKPNLSTGNAENWFNKKDGYTRGQEPKVGAVICWRKGKAGDSSDGAGHVAIVEEVKSNGDVVTSNSAYNGTRFYTKTYKKSNNYYMGSKYTFQGFIYIPKDYENAKTYQGTFPTIPCVAIKNKKGKITGYRKYFANKDKGTQVKYLQQFLNWANNAKLDIDGVVGPKTLAQVGTFQKKVGITVDKKFGNASLAKAKAYKK